jgi:phenylalanyl-tRNA synthetase beta chain
MKVLYSQLKKYLPDLTASVKEISDVFTMIGFMLDGEPEEVTYNGQKDYFLDLEVRQNRVDLFSVQGLGRELSAYYDIPLKTDEVLSHVISKNELFDIKKIADSKSFELPIEVKAKDAVKRVMSIKLSNLKNSQSPEWLKSYLELYEINSINLLVDLTNYVMLETAHASHAFDVKLMGTDKLVWDIDPKKYKKMTTLAGEEVDLIDEALVISDGNKPLSLCIIGGKDVAINLDTTEIILEIAVYDPGLVRRNSRRMKIMTEASSRLEKHLDPDTIPEAFNMLVNLLLHFCGGEIASKLYDNYIKQEARNEIKVNLDKVQQIAGMEITYEESKTYISRLGFEIISDDNNSVTVKRPLNRLDIEQEEDVFEEIIRLKGFYNIPRNRLIVKATKDVTPSHLKLIEKLRTVLTNQAYDEVRSWVLVDEKENEKANSSTLEAIRVTNSINEEVPIIRQSIAVSLIGQLEEFNKNFIEDIRIFEIGKVFGKDGENYLENYALGILRNSKDIKVVQEIVEVILTSCGIENITYKESNNKSQIAHPTTSFDIIIINNTKSTEVGKLFITNSLELGQEVSIAELNISLLDELVKEKQLISSTQEIGNKIVTLDANIISDNLTDIRQVIIDKIAEIKNNVWSWEIVDKFEKDNQIKYTIRVSYMHLGDEAAKELHGKVFG